MTRIDLHTGAGRLDVLLDMRLLTRTPECLVEQPVTAGQEPEYIPGEGWRYRIPATTSGDGHLAVYDGSPAFHAAFGGRTYWRSRSGLSCAGWVPAHAGVARVATYRVDTHRPDLPGLEEVPEVYGRYLVVPVSYVDRQIEHLWPVLDVTDLVMRLQRDGLPARWDSLPPAEVAQAVRYLRTDEIDALLLGRDIGQDPVTLTWETRHPVLRGGVCAPDTRTTTVTVQATPRAMVRLRPVVQHLMHRALRWQPHGDGAVTEAPAHWVGLRRCCGWAYVVRGGVAVDVVDIDELGIAARHDHVDPEDAATAASWGISAGGRTIYLATDGTEGVTYTAASVVERLSGVLPVGYVAVTPDLVVGRGMLWGPAGEQPIAPALELRLIRGDRAAIVDAAMMALRSVMERIVECDQEMEHTPDAGPSEAGRRRTWWLGWAVRLARAAGISVWRAEDPNTPVYSDVILFDLPGAGQVSWHVEPDAVLGLPDGPEWDGHDRAAKLDRVLRFAYPRQERAAGSNQ